MHIGLGGIYICDSHIKDTVGALLPESMDQNVTPVCFLGMTCKLDDRVWLHLRCIGGLSRVTGVDTAQRFIANC
jgi:hypothetical protein